MKENAFYFILEAFFVLKIYKIWNYLKLFKISDCWSRDRLSFDFLEKCLGLVSPPHFVYDFLKKIFLMSYFINWPNLIVRLPLLLEILRSICILSICFPVYDAINFEISLSFLIQPFFYMTKKVRTKIQIY